MDWHGVLFFSLYSFSKFSVMNNDGNHQHHRKQWPLSLKRNRCCVFAASRLDVFIRTRRDVFTRTRRDVFTKTRRDVFIRTSREVSIRTWRDVLSEPDAMFSSEPDAMFSSEPDAMFSSEPDGSLWSLDLPLLSPFDPASTWESPIPLELDSFKHFEPLNARLSLNVNSFSTLGIFSRTFKALSRKFKFLSFVLTAVQVLGSSLDTFSQFRKTRLAPIVFLNMNPEI